MPTRARAMVRMERISDEVSSFRAATMITLKGNFTVTGSRIAGPTFIEEVEEIRVAAGTGGMSVCTVEEVVEEVEADEPKLMDDFPPGGA